MMKTLYKQPLILLWCLLLSGGFLSAQQIAPFTMPSARYAALGGTHAAYAKGLNAILINPAAFAGMDPTGGIMELSLSAYSNKTKLFDLIGDGMNAAGDTDSLLKFLSAHQKELGDFAVGFDEGGPISFGGVGNGFGWGVFNRVHADALLLGQSVKANAYADIFGSFGYGMPFLNINGHVLAAGLSAKAFYRFSLDAKIRLLDLVDTAGNSEGSSFFTLPAEGAFGFGFDLGFQYTWAEALSAGLVWRDFLSPAWPNRWDDLLAGGSPKAADPEYVHPMVDIGVAYKVPIPFGDLNLMLDYRDIADLIVPMGIISRHPLLNIGFGAEYILWNTLFLRLGVADALPAFGIGVKLGAVEIDTAFRGKELGLDPGVRPAWVFDFGFLIRI